MPTETAKRRAYTQGYKDGVYGYPMSAEYPADGELETAYVNGWYDGREDREDSRINP